MGRLSNEPIIQHFSHTHPLQLSSLDHLQQQMLAPILCANCRLPTRGGYGYACSPCSYVLHVQCSQMPPLIQHASHQAHPLSLLPVPAYPEGSFDCDACAKPGTGFSYHCHTCGDVDLHTLCASLPLSLPDASLHAHPLALTFAPPYENKAFSCDVCGGMGSNQWLYRCAPCEFDAHLECGGRQQQQQQAAVGRSGSVVVQGSPRAVAMSRSGSGGMQGLVGVGMVRQMVQGLVSTTTQQIGSRFVPGYAGDGGAGANGGGRGGGPDSAWNGPNQGGRGRGRGIGYNGWNGNGVGRGGGGPPGAWNGYGVGRGQGGGGGPPGAWNGGGRGQGGGGPGAGSDPNGAAQASYGGNGGGNGDGSGDRNGYVDSCAGDVSGGWNGYGGGDGGGGGGGGGNGGDGVDYGSVVDAVAGVDYGSVVDAVAGAGSAVLSAFGGGSDDN